jgi:hypothetical protein
VPEATVEIRARQGDRTVRATYVTLPRGGVISDTRTQLTLPAGRYTLEAYSPDQTGSGKPVFLDDHVITVR